MTTVDDPIELIRRALAGLRFGEITVSVHDGEVVQIARTEKIRTAGPTKGAAQLTPTR